MSRMTLCVERQCVQCTMHNRWTLAKWRREQIYLCVHHHYQISSFIILFGHLDVYLALWFVLNRSLIDWCVACCMLAAHIYEYPELRCMLNFERLAIRTQSDFMYSFISSMFTTSYIPLTSTSKPWNAEPYVLLLLCSFMNSHERHPIH